MNRIIFIGLLLFIGSNVFSQKVDTNNTSVYQSDPYEVKTLFGRNHKIGGYGAFSFGFAQTNKRNTLLAGGRGGVIIGQHLTLGLAGQGFSTDYNQSSSSTGTNYFQVNGGYGGLLIEPIILPRFPIHLSFPLVLGAGGVGSYNSYYDTTNEYWRDELIDDDLFFVVEPGVELEFNLTRFFRLSFGAYYRYTTAIALNGFDKNLLEGLSANIVFKFGKF